MGLSLQHAHFLLLFHQAGTKGCLGTLQLQDNFVAVLSILVNAREGKGRLWIVVLEFSCTPSTTLWG